MRLTLFYKINIIFRLWFTKNDTTTRAKLSISQIGNFYLIVNEVDIVAINHFLSELFSTIP